MEGPSQIHPMKRGQAAKAGNPQKHKGETFPNHRPLTQALFQVRGGSAETGLKKKRRWSSEKTGKHNEEKSKWGGRGWHKSQAVVKRHIKGGNKRCEPSEVKKGTNNGPVTGKTKT